MMKNRAFTLVETVIAITLTAVVLTAVTGLVLMTLRANQRNLHSIQGMYLAQESLEALRFMRDSNWLQNYAWDGGAALWGADFGSSTDLFLKDVSCPPCFAFTPFEEESIYTDPSGFEYVRKLSFQPIFGEDDIPREGVLEVTATVTWQEYGLERSAQLSTYLSNWQ